jgi:hypothetical protein
MTFIRLKSSILEALPKAQATIIWLIKLILPISLGVTILMHLGVIEYISNHLSPVFKIIGLRGEAAIVFLTSVFLTLYAPIAIIATLSLNMREITILATMCLISHNVFIESAIQQKTGSSGIVMFTVRIITSFVSAYILNLLLPHQMGSEIIHSANIKTLTFQQLLFSWSIDSIHLTIKMSLMILQSIMKEFKFIHLISKTLTPFMKLLGLSKNSSFLWIISQLIGLTYGSAILIEEVEKNEVSKYDANLLNFHIAINHSILEDNLLFVSIGVPIVWVFLPRLILAIALVWMIKLVIPNKAIN